MDESDSSDIGSYSGSSLKYPMHSAATMQSIDSPFVIVTPSLAANTKNYHGNVMKSTSSEIDKRTMTTQANSDFDSNDHYQLKQNLMKSNLNLVRMTKPMELETADNNNNNQDTSDMKMNDLRHQSLSHLLKNNTELIKNQNIDLQTTINDDINLLTPTNNTHQPHSNPQQQYAISDRQCNTDTNLDCTCVNCCVDQDKNNNNLIRSAHVEHFVAQTNSARANHNNSNIKQHIRDFNHAVLEDASISNIDSPKTSSNQQFNQIIDEEQLRNCENADDLNDNNVSSLILLLFCAAFWVQGDEQLNNYLF